MNPTNRNRAVEAPNLLIVTMNVTLFGITLVAAKYNHPRAIFTRYIYHLLLILAAASVFREYLPNYSQFRRTIRTDTIYPLTSVLLPLGVLADARNGFLLIDEGLMWNFTFGISMLSILANVACSQRQSAIFINLISIWLFIVLLTVMFLHFPINYDYHLWIGAFGLLNMLNRILFRHYWFQYYRTDYEFHCVGINFLTIFAMQTVHEMAKIYKLKKPA